MSAIAPKKDTAAVQLPAKHAGPSLVTKFAAKYHIEGEKLLSILKATAFKQKKGAAEVTNEQMAALLVVADQYSLNPFTREIFAFPDKQNGIVPVVSVDGWARIINEDESLNGLEFRYSEEMIRPEDNRLDGLKHSGHEWIECVIHRKDRDRPIVIREYLEEVYRPPHKYDDGNTKDGAWQTHTKRFHRHKALIQGARIAFGFAGIFDEDEAERIIGGHDASTEPVTTATPTKAIGASGLKAAVTAAAPAAASHSAVDTATGEITTGEQKPEDKAKPAPPAELLEQTLGKFANCTDAEILGLVRDDVRDFAWTDDEQKRLDDAYRARAAELTK